MATFGYMGSVGGDDFGALSERQAGQSINAGYTAADLADPFRNERKGYQNSLRTLMSNPGEFSSSPFYKFAYDQGLNALQRKGNVRSGNKLAELMKYGQGMAGQLYGQQANLLSTLSGATTGSPAAAGLAVSGAFNRSQDQRQVAAANRAYGGSGGSGGGYNEMIANAQWGKPFDTTPMSGTYQIDAGPSYYTPTTYSPATYTPDYGDYGYSDYGGYGDYDYGDYGYDDYYGEY